jgi:UDP-glucose 4-epimerase
LTYQQAKQKGCDKLAANILITGGAGYIGAHTAAALNKTKNQVIVYDNLSTGHKKALGRNILIEGDIMDSVRLKKVFKEYDISQVVHFAAYSQVGESMQNPKKYYENNVLGTLNLLAAMLDSNIDKLVFSSTAAVYGEAETSPISETSPLQPTNVYGRTKLIMENAMADYSRAYGLKYIALRYFNAAGAMDDLGEDHRPETHLIPLVLKTAMGKTGSIKIFGDDYPTADGTCVRDYIHVEDLAAAHLLAVEALAGGCSSNVYNLGNGNGFSVREVICSAEKVTGIDILKEIAPRRLGDPATLIAGSEKIRRELGWVPRFTNIEEIIRTAWQWHKKFPNGYES